VDGEQRSFGQWLRQARLRDGRTVEALSKAAGLERSYVAKLESGQIKTPTPEKWRPLARELRIPDPVMAAAVGGFLPDDAAQPVRSAPSPVNPKHVAQLTVLLRPRLPNLPDEKLADIAYMLLSLDRRAASAWEEQYGPSKALPPASDRDQDAS
jgi:transcriptional regulator with XRE-family HTH domain